VNSFTHYLTYRLLLAKKSRGLRKGTGYHWDLLLTGGLAVVSSLLGLPWMSAAPVQSLAHAQSLTIYGRHAPGEQPPIQMVVEQRVTTMTVSALIGQTDLITLKFMVGDI